MTIVDTVAFLPTFRKGYEKPYEETASLSVLATAKYIISLFALTAFNLTNALFPSVIAISNLVFVAMLLLRRRQLKPLVQSD